MENKSHAFIAGLFALFFGVAAVVALVWLRGNQERLREYVVVTKYSIGGLNPEAQVRYRGIRVGKVRDIRLDPSDPGDILITIAIAENIPVTKGTVAKLASQGVTGIAHVLLLDNGNNREPLADDGRPPRIVMVPALLDEVSESGTAALRQSRTRKPTSNSARTANMFRCQRCRVVPPSTMDASSEMLRLMSSTIPT